MISAIFTSDWHLGLKVDGQDIYPHIQSIAKQVYTTCKNLKAKGEVDLIIGGDTFETNRPSENEIASVIGLLNNFINVTDNIYILVGNHEAINDGTRTSCLSFIHKMSKKYSTIHLIDNASVMERCTTDYGPIHYLFLPHITKSIAQNENVQEYLDNRVERILNTKVKKGTNLISFAHLDVAGAIKGSEARMLKQSTLKIPRMLTEGCPYGYNTPIILNGHIHTSSKLGNCLMVGSPIYTDFKDCMDAQKYYAVVSIPNSLGDKIKTQRISTITPRFREFSLDIFSQEKFTTIYEVPEFKKFASEVCKGDFVKIEIKVDSERAKIIDLKAVKNKLELDTGCTVKDIIPTIILQSRCRNPEQKLNLTVTEAVKVFLTKAAVTDKKLKYTMAKEYIGRL